MPTDALNPPILCLVTDRNACAGRPLEQVVAQAVAAGVSLVQLREKDLPTVQLLELGTALLRCVRSAGSALVVNGRVDVALALGADGVHLGAGGPPVREVRRVIGGSAIIGVSVHTREEAERAESEGADYLVLGTIFETRSHPGTRGAGPALVESVASAVRVPVIAIGGIAAWNAGAVMRAGASGVAVITAIQSARDVGAATRSLVEAMRSQEQGWSHAPR